MSAAVQIPRFEVDQVEAAKAALNSVGVALFPHAVASLPEFSSLSKQLIGSPYSYNGGERRCVWALYVRLRIACTDIATRSTSTLFTGTFGKKGRAVLSADVYEASNVPRHVYLPPHNDMTCA